MLLTISNRLLFTFVSACFVGLLSYTVISYMKPTRTEVGFSFFLTFISGWILLTVFALLLTLIGAFRLKYITMFLFILSLILFVYHLKNKSRLKIKDVIISIKQWKPNIMITLLLLVIIPLYALFPTKYILGARDYGLYIVNAVHISETGSMQYETDSFIDENYEDLKDFISLEYPALFSSYEQGISNSPGKLDPQFLPYFPSTLAIGYSLGGMEGLIRVNAVISILSALCLYYLLKLFTESNIAALATIFLAINPSQVWGTRITQSEQSSQLLFLLISFCFAYGWIKKKSHFTIIGSFLLGLSALCRIDNYLLGIGMYAITCYCILWKKEYKRQYYIGTAISTFLIMFSVWYGFSYHRYYFYEHFYDLKVLKLLLFALLLCFIVTFLLFLLDRIVLKKKDPFTNPLEYILAKPRNLKRIAAILFAGFIYCLFIRPLFVPGLFGDSIREYSWYISILSYPLAIWGVYSYLKHNKLNFTSHVEPLIFFMLVGIACIIVFTLHPGISSDHFWASRRFVPVNFPVILFFAALGIEHIKLKIFNVPGQTIAALFVVLFMVYQNRIAFATPLFADLDDQYLQVAADIPEGAIVFSKNNNVASVYKHIYNRNVYLLRYGENKPVNYRSMQKFVSEYPDEVYYMGYPPVILQMHLKTTRVGGQIISGDFIERSIGKFPTALFKWQLDCYVYVLEPYETASVSIDVLKYMTADSNNLRYGRYISVESTDIPTLYGPYIELPEGEYKLVFRTKEIFDKPITGTIHVGYWDDEIGPIRLKSVPLSKSGLTDFTFRNSEMIERFEITIEIDDPRDFLCEELSLEIIPS